MEIIKCNSCPRRLFIKESIEQGKCKICRGSIEQKLPEYEMNEHINDDGSISLFKGRKLVDLTDE